MLTEAEFLGLNLPNCPVVSEHHPRAYEVDGVVRDEIDAPIPENHRNTKYDGVVHEADSLEAVQRLLKTRNMELRGAVRYESDEGPSYAVYFWSLRE